MIRVTVELVSAVAKERSRCLGTATIANVGGTEKRGNYRAAFFLGRSLSAWRTAEVEQFPRKQLQCWDLLCRALCAALGDRNGWVPKSATTEANIGHAVALVVGELSEQYDARLKEAAALLRQSAFPSADPFLRQQVKAWLDAYDLERKAEAAAWPDALLVTPSLWPEHSFECHPAGCAADCTVLAQEQAEVAGAL